MEDFTQQFFDVAKKALQDKMSNDSNPLQKKGGEWGDLISKKIDKLFEKTNKTR